MNYNETVDRVMDFLKKKKMCHSSQKSHKDCYDSLGAFMSQRNEVYSDAVRESWFSDIKNSLPWQRCFVWLRYVYQLEEIEITGTISDSSFYLNQSNYDKLPVLWKNTLDIYLDYCRRHYTTRTLEITRILCSEALLFFYNLGIHDIPDITYDAVIKMIETKIFYSDDVKSMTLNNVARMLKFYHDKGLCPQKYSLVFNMQIYPHIGSITDFSDENQVKLKKLINSTISSDELYESIPCFIDLLKGYGYVGSTLALAKHVLTALYLFLDIHSFGFHSDIMWVWFFEIRKKLGSSWLHWRRILNFYEDYTLSGDIHPNSKYKTEETCFDKLPEWCKESISGLLDRKKHEFREIGTIQSYRYACTRFCRFLVDHDYDNFNRLSPAIIKEFSIKDEHTTIKGRASCFVCVRAFLSFLFEKGYTNRNLADCLMTSTFPQEKIVDVLSDDQIRRIEIFRMEHNGAIELRDIAIVLLGLKTGLRASDILELKFQDINWKHRQISIIMQKTKTQLTLPMPVEVGNAIYSYLISGRPTNNIDYIFIKSKAPFGKLTSKVCINALYRILPERKEVKGGGFHVTRRTFATKLLQNHAGVDDVMDALGHRDPTSVMKYLLLDDDRSKKCGLSLDSAGIIMKGALK